MKKLISKNLLFLLLILIVIVAWGFTPLIIPKIYTAQSGAGEIGDVFGSTNALFSGLALLGIIYTIILQSKELGLQREELKLTREELKLTRTEFGSQTKIFNQQMFENTFFQMLKLYNETVGSYLIFDKWPNRETDRYPGRAAIEKEFEGFKHFVLNHNDKGKSLSNPSDYYPAFFIKGGRYLDLSAYFRTIYNILKYIDGSSIAEKKRYTNLLRAQLSDHELGFIFYNCECPLGKEKMKPLVEKYEILKHLPNKVLPHKIIRAQKIIM